MFKRKQSSKPVEDKGVKTPFPTKVYNYLKEHRKVRLVLLGLLGLLVVLGLVFAFYKIVLTILGTIMQFWFRYTSNEILLWFLTLLCFALICGFLYFLWVRRSEYLKKEEEEEKAESILTVDAVDEDWLQSDSGWK